MPLLQATAQPFEVVCDQSDRAAWLKWRVTGIGSSDAPAVLSVPDSYGSPFSVWESKVFEHDEDESREYLDWGNAMEPVILDWFQAHTKIEVVRRGQMLRSVEWPWLLSTMDAIGRENDSWGVIEAKNTAWKGPAWREGAPPPVWTQIQTQLAVSGFPWGYAVAALGGQPPVWQRIARDEKFIREVLVPGTREMWERYVLTKEHPPVDGLPATLAAIKRIWPKDDGQTIQGDGDIWDASLRRDELMAQRKKLDGEDALITNRVRVFMGKASVLRFPDGSGWTYRKSGKSPRTLRREETKNG